LSQALLTGGAGKPSKMPSVKECKISPILSEAHSPHAPQIPASRSLAVLPDCSPAAIANPFEHTLANGLRIIVKEDRRAPTAVHMVWYRAGSMDETMAPPASPTCSNT
jgi:hypothetical protein